MDLFAAIKKLATDNPALRADLIPLLRKHATADKQAGSAKGSIDDAIGQAFSAIVMAMAKGFQKEMAGEFDKMDLDPPGSGVGLNGASALVSFDLEKARVERWGYPPSGWIAFTCSWRPGDKDPLLVANVALGRNQDRIFERIIDFRLMQQAPTKFWSEHKSQIVADFGRTLSALGDK